jgi:hypothetical protein
MIEHSYYHDYNTVNVPAAELEKLSKSIKCVRSEYDKNETAEMAYLKSVNYNFYKGSKDATINARIDEFNDVTKKLDARFTRAIKRFASKFADDDMPADVIYELITSNGGFDWTIDHALNAINDFKADSNRIRYDAREFFF